MFTTLFLGKSASPFFRVTLPGDFDLLRFEVSEHTTTVLMRLRLNTLYGYIESPSDKNN